jgi:DnaJ-class molecular chaperone
VKAAWREIAMRLHPDHGGDAVEFDTAREHYHAALLKSTSRPCPTCGGTGKIIHMSGWSTVTTVCSACG